MQKLKNIWEVAQRACQSRPAWIEVDMAALRANFAEIRRVAGDCPVTAVVKADAYGHGAFKVAECLLAEGAAGLAVATLGEAMQLRAAGIEAPIMLLSPLALADVNVIFALQNHITVPVFSYETAEFIDRLIAPGIDKGFYKEPLAVQLVLDTGMGRIGLSTKNEQDEAVAEASKIAQLPYLQLVGMFSHFATADEADKTYAESQLAAFDAFAAKLAAMGVQAPCLHIANSAALMEMPQARHDMVRAGIILYGYYPSAEVDKSILALTPVMSIKAQLTHVKRVPAGTSISYGCTYTTEAPADIATIPVGYADGWRRLMSNNGCVLVRGQRAPIVGRVCMDQFMVDVTGLGAKVGDEAVLLGRQGDEVIDAEEIAARCGTISYEILSALLPRLPRKYINE